MSFERGIDMQIFSRRGTRQIMGKNGLLGSVLKLLPALQFENDIYVCANVFVFLYDLTLLLGP